MTLPTGPLPTSVFVLAVGVTTLTSLGAHVRYRTTAASFGRALVAAGAVAGLFCLGVAVAWWLTGGGALWRYRGGTRRYRRRRGPRTGSGSVARRAVTVRRACGVDAETTLRFVAAGRS